MKAFLLTFMFLMTSSNLYAKAFGKNKLECKPANHAYVFLLANGDMQVGCDVNKGGSSLSRTRKCDQENNEEHYVAETSLDGVWVLGCLRNGKLNGKAHIWQKTEEKILLYTLDYNRGSHAGEVTIIDEARTVSHGPVSENSSSLFNIAKTGSWKVWNGTEMEDKSFTSEVLFPTN
jgi:hypothetical protein